MRSPAPLPEPIGDGPFRVGDALRAGVHRERLRRSDLLAPYYGVRSASAGSLRDLVAAYATKMPTHHAFGGITAARLWGLPVPNRWTPHEPLVIARPTGTTRGTARGTRHIAVHPTLLTAVPREGVMVLSPLSTLITLGRELDHERLVHVIDALLTESDRYPDLALPQNPCATPEQLAAYLERRARLQGAVAVSAAAADARAGVDSRFESITRRCLVLAGLPEPEVHPLIVIDGLELHPDLGYPELKVAVEYEGEGHLDPKRWAEDILRYEMLEAAGWIVVRITKGDVAGDGARCARRVRAALARRA